MKISKNIRYALCHFFVCCLLYVQSDAEVIEELKPVLVGNESYSQYGRSVAIAGDYAVVGNFDIGRAFIYRINTDGTWDLHQELAPVEADLNADFGTSVAINANYIAIGYPDHRLEGVRTGGCVYIYELSESGDWELDAKLRAEGIVDHASFGRAVALDGSSILIGAPHDGNERFEWSSGNVYLFERSGEGEWHQKFKFAPTASQTRGAFGSSVHMDDDLVIIGAPLESNGAGLYAGSAYIFNRLSPLQWGLEAKLVPSDTVLGEEDLLGRNFGNSVSILGDYALVGMVEAYIGGRSLQPYDGAAFLYHRDSSGIAVNWSIAQEITVKADDYDGWAFGRSVAMNEDYVLIGANESDHYGQGLDSGAGYLFHRTTPDSLELEKVYIPEEPSQSDDEWFPIDDNFGISIGLSENYIIVGAYGYNGSDVDLGAVYIHNHTGGVVNPPAATWFSAASEIQPAGWRYFDWFKAFKPVGDNWIYHGRHGWLYVIAQDTSGMFLWDGALGRWMYTNETVYPWMYAFGPEGGWLFFFENGTPGSRFFGRGDNGQVISEGQFGL